jgi:hypothetical protein
VHLRFDDVPPAVALEPPDPADPTLLSAQAADAVSGIAQGQIEVRRSTSDSWHSLPTNFDGTHLTAHVDDENLPNGTYAVRAHAVDAAGNERTTSTRADGQSATITLPLRLRTRFQRISRHNPRAGMAGRIRVGYGRAVRIRGRLVTAEGNPLQDAEIQVFSQARRQGARTRLVAQLKTSRRGAFSYRAPKGVSRTIRFRYDGTPTIEGATHEIALLVRARSTLHTNGHRFRNGDTVRFHGHLAGRSIPAGGKLVELQVILRGAWHTFATTHAGRRGTWRYDYRFNGTLGRQTYRFRVRIPRESNYPYETGASRSVVVRVRGL